MKILWICNESPFPATHGGRVDVWRRLCALSDAGAEIFLVFWSGDSKEERPTEQDFFEIQKKVSKCKVYEISRCLKSRLLRLARLSHWPSHVASRVLSNNQYDSLLDDVSSFGPEIVWLDSLYGGVLAMNIANKFGIPLFYRSHNVEHLYMAKQISKSNNLRDRLAWCLNLPHLKGFEKNIINNSAIYYDISNDDLSFWKNLGFLQGRWLPPMIDKNFAQSLSAPNDKEREFDVSYLGNLFTPNNVDGVLWFLNNVVNKLRNIKPDIKICIAGSKPVQAIIDTANKHSVTLIPSPSDIVPILRNARVLINPVFAGSGVNIKAVEMLFTSAELVSTSQGLAGLPSDVTTLFRQANDSLSFTNEIISGLCETHQSAEEVNARIMARLKFSSSQAEDLLNQLHLYKNNNC